MRTFIADIIPSIQRYSMQLNNVTNFTNKNWVMLDTTSNIKTVYIFRTNGEIIISVNGLVSTDNATWEYLGNNTILLRLKNQAYLLRHGFIDDFILALKLDNNPEYAIFINEEKYNGKFNSIENVINFLDQNYLINPPGVNGILNINTVSYIKSDFTFKMGFFEIFLVTFQNNNTYKFYKKIFSDTYFVYEGKNSILTFKTKSSCLNYLASFN